MKIFPITVVSGISVFCHPGIFMNHSMPKPGITGTAGEIITGRCLRRDRGLCGLEKVSAKIKDLKRNNDPWIDPKGMNQNTSQNYFCIR